MAETKIPQGRLQYKYTPTFETLADAAAAGFSAADYANMPSPMVILINRETSESDFDPCYYIEEESEPADGIQIDDVWFGKATLPIQETLDALDAALTDLTTDVTDLTTDVTDLTTDVAGKAETSDVEPRLAFLEASTSYPALSFPTWTALSAVSGVTEGQSAIVATSDAGTHTDPVVGGTVSNTGQYGWSSSPAGWRRDGPLGASLAGYQQSGTIASGTTTDIGAVAADFIRMSGTATITSLGTATAGIIKHIQTIVAGATITHNSTSLRMPGSANRLCSINDSFGFVSLGSGNWLNLYTKRADGKAVVNPAIADITGSGAAGQGILAATTYAAVKTLLGIDTQATIDVSAVVSGVLDISALNCDLVIVTGTGATITSFGTTAGNFSRDIQFVSAGNTIVHGISGGQPNLGTLDSITTQAGDTARFRKRTGTASYWKMMNWNRADGTPLAGGSEPMYISSLDADNMYIYQPPTVAGKKRIGWLMSRNEAPERNQDNWKIRGLWETSGSIGSLDRENMIGTTGEWELALNESGAAGFVGGNHGNEELVSAYCLIDGVLQTLGSYTGTADTIEFFQHSEYFQCGTTEETKYVPKGQKMLDAYKRWRFQGGELTHWVAFEVAVTLTPANVYLFMGPFARLVGATAVTTTAARSYAYAEEDIADYPRSSMTPIKADVVKMWGEGGYGFEMEALSGYTTTGRGTKIVCASDVSPNKVYFDLGTATLTAGDIIEASVRYRVTTINDN